MRGLAPPASRVPTSCMRQCVNDASTHRHRGELVPCRPEELLSYLLRHPLRRLVEPRGRAHVDADPRRRGNAARDVLLLLNCSTQLLSRAPSEHGTIDDEPGEIRGGEHAGGELLAQAGDDAEGEKAQAACPRESRLPPVQANVLSEDERDTHARDRAETMTLIRDAPSASFVQKTYVRVTRVLS